MNSPRFIGILWVVAQFGLLIFWAVTILTLPDPLNRAMRFIPLTLLGIALLLFGIVLAGAGTAGLGSNLTPSPEPKEGAGLIETGIYARVRHPIYGGILLIVWGVTIPLVSAVPALAAAGITLFFRAKAGYEEKRLRKRFPRYAAYVLRTWRFLPRLGLKKRA